MGRLAQVISYIVGAVNKLKVNMGGGNEAQVEIITPAGYESKPLKNDRSFVVESRRTGNYKHIGIQSGKGSNSLKDGEARVFSRDADGNIIASVTVFNDGDLLVGNANGSLLLKADGSIDANGAVITKDGDVVSAAGISLNTHVHQFVETGTPGTYLTGVAQ